MKKILNKDQELVELELKVPFLPDGRIVISPVDIVITRDNGATRVTIHKYYCNVEKGLNLDHDSEDLRDIPGKDIGICLKPKDDTILVGLQNEPWIVEFSHLSKKMKLLPQN